MLSKTINYLNYSIIKSNTYAINYWYCDEFFYKTVIIKYSIFVFHI